jgi:hypothetical protein
MTVGTDFSLNYRERAARKGGACKAAACDLQGMERKRLPESPAMGPAHAQAGRS